MRVAGIDPGKDGGYCVLNKQGQIEILLPLAAALAEYVAANWNFPIPDHVFIEKAQVMAIDRGTGKDIRPSAVAMFNYGQGFGEILGIMRVLKIPHTLVRPADWTRVMHMGTTGTTADKQRSYEAASRIFPSNTFMVPGRKKPHDGLFEAALIAEFGRRQLARAL